jgi:hypothetical protein
VIFSWFACQVFALADREKDALLKFGSGQVIMKVIGDYVGFLATTSWLLLAVALGFTALYLYTELQNRKRMSVPNVLSVLLLYAIFLYDFLVGYREGTGNACHSPHCWRAPPAISGCGARCSH